MIAYVPTIITFQSTPPRRRRRNSILFWGFCRNFQSTPPRRRRLKGHSKLLFSCNFQSTPPRRRRLIVSMSSGNKAFFQSTPPRRRRLSVVHFDIIFISFSIHASAKEATVNTGYGADFINFSIHASAKEATYNKVSNENVVFFQSTPPRRRRPQHIVIPQLSCAYLVSTTFLSTIFSFISQYIVLFPLFRVRMPCVFCVAYDSHYVPLFNIFYILFQGTPF